MQQLRFVVVLALLVLAFGQGARSAEPRVDLDVTVGQSWTDNATYTSDVEESDTVSRLALEIPFRHERPTRTVSLTYNPTYYRYEDFDDLDHLEHLFRFDLTTMPNPRTTWTFGAAFFDTQDQSLAPEFGAETEFLTERTDRRTVRGFFEVDRSVSEKWHVVFGAGVRILSVDEISGLENDVDESRLGDQKRYNASVGGRRELSERTSAGLTYRYQTYDLDFSEDEDVHGLRFDVQHAASRKLSTRFAAGASYVDPPEGESSETELEAEAGMIRKFERGSLDLGVSHGYTNGGALAGGSTVSEARLGYSDARGKRWSWSAWTGFAQRDPADSSEKLDYWRSGVGLSFRGPRFEQGRLRESIGCRLRGRWIDQSGSDDETFNTSYYVVSAVLVFSFGV